MLILERPWRTQPQGAVGVDWSNPVANGLRAAVSPGLMQPTDATGLHGISRQGTITLAPTPAGMAALINATSYINLDNDDDLFGNQLSVFAVQNQIEAPAASFNTAFVNAKDASWNDANGWHFQIDNTSLLFIAGGSSYISTAAPSSLGIHTYGATYNAGACRTFIDGTFRASGSIGTTIPAASNPVRIGDSVWKLDTSAHILLVAIWRRTLTDAEQISLHANPWQLFQPRRIYIPTAAAAATAPTITALSAINITATSAQPQITYA